MMRGVPAPRPPALRARLEAAGVVGETEGAGAAADPEVADRKGVTISERAQRDVVGRPRADAGHGEELVALVQRERPVGKARTERAEGVPPRLRHPDRLGIDAL